MKTVLVTGAGGYIGTTLVDMLLERGDKVIGLDRYFFGSALMGDTRSHPNFTLVRKDIRDVTEADMKGVDAVCDLASLSNDPSGDIDPDLTIAVNHKGRAHVARTAKAAGVAQYILASSCSVYGHGETENLDETSPTNPLTAYAKCNLAAEKDIFPLADEVFTATALRQATVFGLSKRMRFDLVINIMTLNAVEKGRVFVLGGGKQWRPIVHVKDTARAFIDTLDAPKSKINGEAFNIGTYNLQIRSLAYMVRENVPFPVEIDIVPEDADQRDYNVSFDKATNVLGFKPQHGPGEGAREIYNALKRGLIDGDERTYTVKWYKKIVDAKAILDEIECDGRLL